VTDTRRGTRENVFVDEPGRKRCTPLDFEIRSSHRICFRTSIPSAVDAALLDFCYMRRRAGSKLRSSAVKKVKAGRSYRWRADVWAKSYKKAELVRCSSMEKQNAPSKWMMRSARREGYWMLRSTSFANSEISKQEERPPERALREFAESPLCFSRKARTFRGGGAFISACQSQGGDVAEPGQ